MKMFKFLKASCSILFAMVFVFALSFSILQANEETGNSSCNKPCGSKDKVCDSKKQEECKAKNKSECCQAKKAKQLSSTAESDAEKVVLNVKGMTCGGCEGRVKGVLIKCAGVTDAQVSHKDGNAFVKVEDGKADMEELIKAVEGAGFPASEG